MTSTLPVAWYEGRYSITDEGQVINLANNQPLSLRQNQNGYLIAVLANGNGTSEQLLVHRLVALHFIPNPHGHPQVNHKNGNKQDNRSANLEWVSATENAQHALRTGLRPGYMSMDEKLQHLDTILDGKPVNELANEIGRHPVTLSKMCREAAKKVGRHDEWTAEMKRRRRDVATCNLEKINS